MLKKNISALFFIGLFLSTSLYAETLEQQVQESPQFSVLELGDENDDGFEVSEDLEIESEIEKDTKTKSGLLEFWDRHGKGAVGGFTVSGKFSTKSLMFLNLAVDYDWKIAKFYVEGSVLNSNTKLESESTGRISEIEREKTLLKNAYVDLSLLDNLNLSLGRQTVVWGQFDIFSPVDFALPFDFDFAGQAIGKVANRRPQDVAKLTWFPIESLEVQGYYFPNYQNMFEDNQEFFGGKTLVLPNEDDDDQRAVRVLYYHDWATVGLTYYDGWNYMYPSQKSSITGDINDGVGSLRSVEGDFEVLRNRMIGIEIAKPIGRYVWKFEIAKSDRLKSLERPFSSNQANIDYANWIINKNNRSLNVNEEIYFTALGFDADLNKWRLNIAILNQTTKYSGIAQEGVDLEEAARSDTETSFGATIPTILVQYFLREDKTSHIGFGAGFLSGFLGGTLYYSQEFRESLTLMAGYEYGMYFADQQASNEDDNDEGSSDDNPFLSGFRFGLAYQF